VIGMNNKILAVLLLGMLFIFGCSSASNLEPVESPSGSFYKSFTKAEFEAAKASGKTIFLEFHANWCSVCRTQEVNLGSAFSDPQMPGEIAGFRVNYRDSETNSDEVALAQKYGITYQYSKIIIGANGKVLLKEVATPWSKQQTIEKLKQNA